MSAFRDHVRIGRAAEMLGVTVDTLRRWAEDGRLKVVRSDGGQRLVPIDEVTRLIGARRQAATDRTIVAQSARNRRLERMGTAERPLTPSKRLTKSVARSRRERASATWMSVSTTVTSGAADHLSRYESSL